MLMSLFLSGTVIVPTASPENEGSGTTLKSRKLGAVLLVGIIAGALIFNLLRPGRSEAPAVLPPSAPLFIAERGCFGCHRWEGVKPFEQGPSLDGAGEKLRPGWVERFLDAPQQLQPHGRMPRLELSVQERADLQAMLASGSTNAAPRGDAVRGRQLYETNQCVKCHADLTYAAAKLNRAWLVSFLQNPGPDMPTFGLSEADAADFAEFLLEDQTDLEVTSGSAERGHALFIRHGCAACHSLEHLRGPDMTKLLTEKPARSFHDFDLAFVEHVLQKWTTPGQGPAPSLEDEMPENYWELPVPPQGQAPRAWSGLERSLHPAACGVCHPVQFAEWKSSLHARAFGPGFRAELRSGVDDVSTCHTCHTPLSEQADNPELRRHAIVCSSCHVRGHRRFGPTQEQQREGPSAHGGAVRSEAFERAEFCVRCHQFGEGQDMPGGKFVMDVYREWREARQERACQSCHMPDRRHLWRGIHDRDMVRGAMKLEIEAGERIEIKITNSGAGHMMPTYIVPLIVLSARFEDAAGREIEGTLRTWEIGRELTDSLDEEISDTRLKPGETRTYIYEGSPPASASRIVAAVDVHPDHLYLGLFESRLRRGDLDTETRALYREAHDRPLAPAYRALTVRKELKVLP